MVNPVNQNQQLANYVKKNIQKGYTEDSLRFALVRQGYSRTSVDKSIELANKQLSENAPRMEEKPVISVTTFDESGIKDKLSSEGGFFSRLWKKIKGE